MFPQQQLNSKIGTLFRAFNHRSPTDNTIRKGTLLSFNYTMYVHDPYPLVIVSDVIPGKRIKGINLHYLTFPYIRELLKIGGENPIFSYQMVKGNKFVTDAFRIYRWTGIRTTKILDTQFLLTVMNVVRSIDPAQIEAIRGAIQEQINQITNPPAVPTLPKVI